MDTTERSMLSFPLELKDDVDQEMAILELLGVKGNRSLVRKRLRIQLGRVLTYDDAPLESRPVQWADYNRIDPEATARLVAWALDQIESVQQIIWDFLHDPSEKLEDTLLRLQELGYAEVQDNRPQVMTLKEMMMKALPATLDDLIELVQIASPETRRPAATVRQFIRRHIGTAEVYLEDGVVHVTRS